MVEYSDEEVEFLKAFDNGTIVHHLEEVDSVWLEDPDEIEDMDSEKGIQVAVTTVRVGGREFVIGFEEGMCWLKVESVIEVIP